MEIILITDPKVLSIPIHECHEPLIDLRDKNDLLIGPSPEIENNLCYTNVRKSVFERLVEAQKQLPNGYRICLYEGLRTLELQESLFNQFWKKVVHMYPTKNKEEIFQEVVKMVSPVENLDGSKNIPPHSTGAAVDVYLVNSDGYPIDMGILVKDWMLDVDGSLSKTKCPTISAEAKLNRKILSKVMTSAGFVNMPTEYWHWSYGDRYWALSLNIKKMLFMGL